MTTFTVHGTPVAQPRSRARMMVKRDPATGEKRSLAHIYVSERHAVQEWKERIRKTFMVALGVDARKLPKERPVMIKLVFRMPRPERLKRRSSPIVALPHIVKPDADNLAKAALDALRGLVFSDDKRVFKMAVEKWYVDKDGAGPCMEVYFNHWIEEGGAP